MRASELLRNTRIVDIGFAPGLDAREFFAIGPAVPGVKPAIAATSHMFKKRFMIGGGLVLPMQQHVVIQVGDVDFGFTDKELLDAFGDSNLEVSMLAMCALMRNHAEPTLGPHADTLVINNDDSLDSNTVWTRDKNGLLCFVSATWLLGEGDDPTGWSMEVRDARPDGLCSSRSDRILFGRLPPEPAGSSAATTTVSEAA